MDKSRDSCKVVVDMIDMDKEYLKVKVHMDQEEVEMDVEEGMDVEGKHMDLYTHMEEVKTHDCPCIKSQISMNVKLFFHTLMMKNYSKFDLCCICTQGSQKMVLKI